MVKRQRQALLFGIIGLVGILLIFLALWLYGRQHIFVRYANRIDGFVIKYPADWTYEENKGGASVILYSPAESSLDNFKENVNVVVQDLSANPMSLEKYTDTAIKQAQLVFEKNLIIQESSPTILAGRPGYLFSFLGKGPDTEVQFLIVWTVADLKAYQVTYTAVSSKYDKYLGQAKRMIGSFRIL